VERHFRILLKQWYVSISREVFEVTRDEKKLSIYGFVLMVLRMEEVVQIVELNTITQGVGKRAASAMMMDIMKLGLTPEKEMFC
jgi:hypothetical protein